MIIAVDFDGTCVTHEYPKIGQDLPWCVPALLALVKSGHRLILYTMRSGDELAQAVQWFADRKIPLWGVNENPDQHKWTSSPKVYAHMYIDDAALGCRLVKPENQRPYVDWNAVIFDLRVPGVIHDTVVITATGVEDEPKNIPHGFGPQEPLPEGWHAWYADIFSLIESREEKVKAVFIPAKYREAVIKSGVADETPTFGTLLWRAEVVWMMDHTNGRYALGERGSTISGDFMQPYKEMAFTPGQTPIVGNH